jgi:hypothetical protein
MVVIVMILEMHLSGPLRRERVVEGGGGDAVPEGAGEAGAKELIRITVRRFSRTGGPQPHLWQRVPMCCSQMPRQRTSSSTSARTRDLHGAAQRRHVEVGEDAERGCGKTENGSSRLRCASETHRSRTSRVRNDRPAATNHQPVVD